MTHEKTREDVEKLKEKWLYSYNPLDEDIEDTEGFEAYYDELFAFRSEKGKERKAKQKEWEEAEIAKMRQKAAEKFCPISKTQCLVDLCAWWHCDQCAVASASIGINIISEFI